MGLSVTSTFLMDLLLQRTDQHKMCQWSFQDGKNKTRYFSEK
jgi:hypothetical protein